MDSRKFCFVFGTYGNNYDFLIVEKINADGYSFKVSPMFAYALKDNMALGGRLNTDVPW